MSRINTNVGSLVAQKTYGRSQADLSQALTRLSTGLKINSGKDDPAGLIASENLRRDITASERAITNTERAGQLIGTADSALGQISNLLNDIRGLVTEASNKGVLSDEQIAANQLQIDSSLDAIDRIAKVTTFQGRKILDGSLDFTTTSPGATVSDLNIQQANLGTSNSLGVSVDITSAATQATITTGAAKATANFTLAGQTFTLTANTPGVSLDGVRVDVQGFSGITDAHYNSSTKVLLLHFDTTNNAITSTDVINAFNALGNFTTTATGSGTIDGTSLANTTGIATTAITGNSAIGADLTFQLTGGKGAEVFSFSQGATLTQISNAVNLVSDSTGVTASITSGRLQFKSTEYGSLASVKVDTISEGAGGAFRTDLSAQNATGTDIAGTINGYTATGKGNTISLNSSALSFDATVAAGSSTDFSFTINGGGATFQLGPDVSSSQQVRVGINSVNTGKLGGSAGRLYELRSGQTKSLASNPSGAAQVVDQVIEKVTSARGRLGAFQRTTLETNKASLSDTITALTEAQSSIRDADFAKESSNLTRAQILVQSGTTVLQQANQAPQAVLSLLRG
ncbi:MAG: flagellin [Planctomycetaceae bacterium]